MPHDRAPVLPATLYPRRLAVRALGLVLDAQGLKDVALRLNPDDPEQAFPGPNPGEVRLGERLDSSEALGNPGAFVFIDEQARRARVVVPRLLDLLRPNHRLDFDLRELGLYPRPDDPDLDVEVDLVDLIGLEGELLRTAPQRILPPRTGSQRRFGTIRNMGSRGRG